MTANIHYRIEAASLNAHQFGVTLTIAQPQAQQRLSMATWIPGSYLIREFARHVIDPTASQNGQAVTLKVLDKCTWQADCTPDHPLVVHYRVYARDASVRTAWLDSQRGFFNPTSLCLMVQGQSDGPHHIQISSHGFPNAWRVATGLAHLAITAQGFGEYSARDWDELADSPFTLADFWQGEFTVRGVLHQLVVTGHSNPGALDQLLKDTQSTCQAAWQLWHGDQQGQPPLPINRYVFMLHATADGYGGLEHRNSTALICGRNSLPLAPKGEKPLNWDDYIGLLGLISHEYFHTWNVKQLRPVEFTCYHYTQENHTSLLWFFEGFTSYYDDLLLLRAGLIDTPAYFKLLEKTLQQVDSTPGRLVQTVAQASFDAWTKYYRVDENTHNLTVSYYTKGALVALCMDLTLRQQGSSLDHLMRSLWTTCQGGPMDEAQLLAVLGSLTTHNWPALLNEWVHSTTPLPVEALLNQAGIQTEREKPLFSQQLGVRVTENESGIAIKAVDADSPAEQAGLAAGDEWLAVGEWRVKKWDEVKLHALSNEAATVLVSRDKKLIELQLNWPKDSTANRGNIKLSLQNANPMVWPAATDAT